MKFLCYLALLSSTVLPAGPMNAAPAALTSMGEAETNWPGIKFQVVGFKRIPTNRLLVSVAVVATPKAPVAGTAIVGKPGNTAEAEGGNSFSLSTSTMTDEKTSQKYAALKPDPNGQQYIPGETQTLLRPGQMEIMTVQFEVPPPLPNAGHEEKQYVDVLLANAKSAIKLTIPNADLGNAPKAN